MAWQHIGVLGLVIHSSWVTWGRWRGRILQRFLLWRFHCHFGFFASFRTSATRFFGETFFLGESVKSTTTGSGEWTAVGCPLEPEASSHREPSKASLHARSCAMTLCNLLVETSVDTSDTTELDTSLHDPDGQVEVDDGSSDKSSGSPRLALSESELRLSLAYCGNWNAA